MAQEQAALLRLHGYLPGNSGALKALQGIMRRLEKSHSGDAFPRTATDKYATSADALETLRGTEPFFCTLLQYRAVEKLRGAFLGQNAKTRSARFIRCVENDRTDFVIWRNKRAEFAPKDDRVRSCFLSFFVRLPSSHGRL